MQIRCQHCHKPFGLGKETVLVALDEMAEGNLGHYDVNCPHCGKANHVSRTEFLRAAPGWVKRGTDQEA